MNCCHSIPTRERPSASAPALRFGRRGSALVYLTVSMVALVAFVSLAVDVGRVQMVRGELQLAADAAARYGAAGLETGVSAAEQNAVNAARDNKADGTAVVLDPNTDVEFGTWNESTKTFTALTGAAQSGANAVRVTARRTADSGNAVPLFFARVIGRTTCDVRAQSVARYQPDPLIHGVAGMNGITFRNNAFFGSYNSSATTAPAEATALSGGTLYSNGAISAANGSDMKGNVVIGPSAPAVSGISITGTTARMAAAIVAPAEVSWSPAANPNGTPQAYTANGNVTLPGGTYWFTSVTINGSLSFSGPATVTVNGPVEINGALLAYNLVPGNLKVFQIGATTFADSDGNGNNINIVADVSAPQAAFMARNNLLLRGRLIAASIDVKNNAEIYYDLSLGTTEGSRVVTVR
jgi:Flp pilus assembly protein TadG